MIATFQISDVVVFRESLLPMVKYFLQREKIFINLTTEAAAAEDGCEAGTEEKGEGCSQSYPEPGLNTTL